MGRKCLLAPMSESSRSINSIARRTTAHRIGLPCRSSRSGINDQGPSMARISRFDRPASSAVDQALRLGFSI